jgi:hypothetical protein
VPITLKRKRATGERARLPIKLSSPSLPARSRSSEISFVKEAEYLIKPGDFSAVLPALPFVVRSVNLEGVCHLDPRRAVLVTLDAFGWGRSSSACRSVSFTGLKQTAGAMNSRSDTSSKTGSIEIKTL